MRNIIINVVVCVGTIVIIAIVAFVSSLNRSQVKHETLVNSVNWKRIELNENSISFLILHIFLVFILDALISLSLIFYFFFLNYVQCGRSSVDICLWVCLDGCNWLAFVFEAKLQTGKIRKQRRGDIEHQ